MNNIRDVAVAIVATMLVCGGSAWAIQEDPAADQAREEIGAQIEELETTLKAAVMSGAVSGPDAREIYGRVVRAAKASYVRDFGDGDKDDAGGDPGPKTNVVRLTSPRPEQIRVLLQPEFLRRDVQLIRDELELDRDQMLIVQFLFDDYTEAFELASAPLGEALAQYRGTTLNSYIAFALEDAGVRLDAAVESARRADRDEAVARMSETLARIDREKAEDIAGAGDDDRQRYETWKESMIAATSELDERLAAIRERATAQLSDMGRDDATITAQDLLRMAETLRADRVQLRADLADSIAMITTESQRGEDNGRFDAAMARVRIGQLLPKGRFGGESMNLWAAMQETLRGLPSSPGGAGPLAYAEELLDAAASEIAAKLDERTEATLDREIAGIEFRAVRDQIAAANGESIFALEERRLTLAADPYADALRREVAASESARNALLALLEESSASIDAAVPDSDLAAQYRASALRRGFPVETRRRWAERAMAAAQGFDDLDDTVTEALVTLAGEIGAELKTLRDTAIEERIRRDPKLARDFIDSEFEDEKIEFDDAIWREVEFAAFAAVDDRAETHMKAILSPEQFERLPVRRRWGDKGPAKDDGGKGGKGNGK